MSIPSKVESRSSRARAAGLVPAAARGRVTRRAIALCLALAGMTATPAARAQADPAAGKAQAEALYQEAKALMAKGQFEEACPRLAESQKLDPGGGTLLNLAVCHEKAGKIATAWAELNEALSVARRDGRDDRVKLAEEHIQLLAPRLPRLTITVPPGSSADGLVIKLGGILVGPVSYGTSMPIDPGLHTVRAEAPGRTPWTTTIETKEGTSSTVEPPPLAAAPAAPKLPPPTLKPEPPNQVQPASKSNSLQIAGFVIGGVGVAALGVGAGFGVTATSRWSESNAQCPEEHCNQMGADLSLEATQAAPIANIAIGVGAAGVIAGATLLIVAGARKSGVPDKRAERSPGHSALAGVRVTAAPFFDGRGGGLAVRGTW
jgi:hypothetical protein